MGKEERMRRFMDHVRKCSSIGVNLTSLALGCSVKVDLYNVLYPALRMVKGKLSGLNIEVAPREDVAVLAGKGTSLVRVIASVDSPKIPKNLVASFNPDTLIILAEVFQGNAGDPSSFAEALLKLYEELGSLGIRVTIGKGHSIVSTKPDVGIYVLDFVKTVDKGDGYTLINNDTIQVIDPTDEIASYRQVAVALSNAFNDLFSKGAHRDLEIYPVYDAPYEYVDEVRVNILRYAESLGARVHEVEQPGLGYLLIGATVAGWLDKRPPMFYDKVKEGFKVIVTRPFGELSIMGTYVTLHLDEELYDRFEKDVMPVDELEKLKDHVLDTMTKPNVEVAKIIYEHLPELNEEFEEDEHIAATIDISGPGIFVFKELAENAGVDIRLTNIPLMSPEVAKFAASNYIIADATAGTNGAIAIVVSGKLADRIIDELEKIPGLKPMIIGEVASRGNGKLMVPNYVVDYVADKSLLAKLTLASNILQGVSRSTNPRRLACAEIRVFGKVQGVGFRPMVKRHALSLGLLGFARNEPDGSVLIVVEGEEDNIRAFVESLRFMSVGEVERLEVEWGSYRGIYSGFSIS